MIKVVERTIIILIYYSLDFAVYKNVPVAMLYTHTGWLAGWLVYLVISRHNNTTRNSGGGALTLCGIAPKLYKKRNIKLNDNSPWIIICAKTVVGGCVVPYIILVLLLLLQYQRATLAKKKTYCYITIHPIGITSSLWLEGIGEGTHPHQPLSASHLPQQFAIISIFRGA